MANAKLVKQIVAETPNRVGMLAEVTQAVSKAGANIEAICAYGMEGKAVFLMITDNNKKALTNLNAKGYKTKEEDVVAVNLINKVGSAYEIAEKLKNANIDLTYIYGSTGQAKGALIVFKSNDNAKALEILK